MYHPPEIIYTSLYSKLPESMRKTGQKSDWLQSRERHNIHSFLEGPTFDAVGNLYCTDIPFGRIFKVDANDKFETIAEYDGEPNGMKVFQNDQALIADHRRGLLTLNLKTGNISVVVSRAWGEGFRGLNDLIIASNGDIYFTDQGQSGLQDPTGKLYRLRSNGELEIVLSGIPSPNGLAFNPDESMLYLNVTRTNQVWRVPIDRNGHASKVGVFLNMSGGGGPDGLAVDTKGNLFVAAPGTESVWVFSPLGEPIHRMISKEGKRPTNIAFGGANNQTLFITESGTGTISCVEMPTPGLTLFGQRN
jgi:gluconolactonase